MHTSTKFGGGACLTQGYNGCRGNTPQPVPMVQHGSDSVEKGCITAVLCRLPQAQCMYQEGLISLAMNAGSIGKYGGCSALFQNGF